VNSREARKRVSLSGDGERLPVRECVVAALPLLEPGEGSDLWLSLVSRDGSRVSVLMGVGELVALAADLLQVARVRCGRQDWPPKLGSAR
jgi:hypothetical protein